jgi:hypothetical protein
VHGKEQRGRKRGDAVESRLPVDDTRLTGRRIAGRHDSNADRWLFRTVRNIALLRGGLLAVSLRDGSAPGRGSNDLTAEQRELLEDIARRPWTLYTPVLIAFLRFWLRILPLVAILAAFVLGASWAPNQAGKGYFSAAAQVIPVLLLAMAVESQLLSFGSLFKVEPQRKYSAPTREAMKKTGGWIVGVALRVDSAEAWYVAVSNALTALMSGVAVLALLSFAEWDCLRILASGDAADPELVSGGILAGLVGVRVIALMGRAGNRDIH